MIRVLLRAGDVEDAPNASGMTALMLAAVNGHPVIVDRLVALGHNIDASNAKGNSALLICAQRGDVDSVRDLLRLGASRKLLNKNRLNAADLARRLGQDQVLAVLSE
jgi:ankyrin repeat protein